MNKKELVKFINETYNKRLDESYEIFEFVDFYAINSEKDNFSYLLNKTNEDIYVSNLSSSESFKMVPRFSIINKINRIDANRERIKEMINGIHSSHIIIEGINVLDNSYYKIITNTENIFLNKESEIMKDSKEEAKKMFEDIKNKENDKTISTPNLDKYGYDITSDKFIKDPAIGRESEIKRIEQILLYPEKDKSIIIVGDAGCGKTSLVKGLAYRIQNKDVPKQLKDLKIISIDVTTLVAGTKYVGTLEEKMKTILDEASKDKNIVLFIDEMHQAISGGKTADNNNSVAEILKPYLDFGRVRVIGATTKDEYVDEIEQNQAFKTRFKKIEISEPNYEVLYEILDSLITKYNEISYSKLDCSDEEKDMYINWLIRSTNKNHRDYFDRSTNPRLVLDIVKEAYAIANINERENVIKEDFIEALNNEDRLSKSGKEQAICELEYLVPQKNECMILQFPKKNAY